MKYNKLTIIEQIESYISPKGQIKKRFLCKCDCGNYINVTLSNLSSKNTTSCGCVKKGKKTIHDIPIKKRKYYDTWMGIKKRCFNKNSKDYYRYGGRGIILFEEWCNDYIKFENWILQNLGERPQGFSLDRINNDGNYEPNNLRWATKKEQANNKSNIKIINY